MLKMLILPIIATIGAGAIPASLLPVAKPTPPPGGTIIVKIIPEGNYVIDGEGKAKQETAKTLEHKETTNQTPDSRLEEMKKQLDKRFGQMFNLKQQLESAQNSMAKKWEQYYAMNEAYNKELKRIIADWVTDNMYEAK